MKKYLIISLLTLVFSVTMVSAASTNFTANGDITIDSVTGSGVSAALTILNGSQAESWTFSSGSLSVINANPSNRFRVGSDDAGVISMRVNNASGNEIACVDGNGGVAVPAGSGDAYNVYPSATACTAAASSRGSSGGGGGSSSFRPAVPAIPAVPGISPAIPAVPASPALANASARAFFNRRLVAGSVGDDVRSLQQFLNGRGFTVSVVGPGSVGNETTTFGPATKRALTQFQLTNGVIQDQTDPGAGTLGPKTRAKINELGGDAGLNNGASVQAPVVFSPDQLNQLLELMRRLQFH